MTDNCEKCGKPYLLVEYSGMDPCHCDGVSELVCEPCGVRKGRWSGRDLRPGEHEPPYGERHSYKCSASSPR